MRIYLGTDMDGNVALAYVQGKEMRVVEESKMDDFFEGKVKDLRNVEEIKNFYSNIEAEDNFYNIDGQEFDTAALDEFENVELITEL